MAALTLQSLSASSASRREPAWLRERREAAFQAAQRIPPPSLRIGLGIALNLEPLDIGTLNPEDLLGAGPLLIPRAAGAEILPLADALDRHGPLLEHLLFSAIPIEADRFAALHAAFVSRVLFIRVPAETKAAEPILLDVAAAGPGLYHILVVAEPGSDADIVLLTSGQASLRSEAVEVFAQEGARVRVMGIQYLSQDSRLVTFKHAVLAKGAQVTWLDAHLGGALVSASTHARLDAPGADAKTLGLFYGSGSQAFHLRAASHHAAPRTRSDILAKGALDGHARAVFRGLVKIGPDAAQSDGHQHARALLLSDAAEMDAVPNLEIDTHDVTCGHGAAVGSLDPEQLFYLETRGIPEGEARRAIVGGFFAPLLAALPTAELQERLAAAIQARL